MKIAFTSCCDIHEPKIKERQRINEFTASAMAQTASITGIVGKQSNVFGLLEINETHIRVDIFQLNLRTNELIAKKSAAINLNIWNLQKIRDC
jgi:hypothetical protein